MLFEAKRWQEGVQCYTVDLDITAADRRTNTTFRADSLAHASDPHAKSPKLINLSDDEFCQIATPSYPIVSNHPFIPSSDQPINPYTETMEDLIAAMILGLRDYIQKTGAFKGIGIALSGGKDSVLTLLIAYLCFKQKCPFPGQSMKDILHCFSMPSKYNSDTTKGIARMICEELGTHFVEYPIQDAFESETEVLERMTQHPKVKPITLQNIQARIRAMRMWNLANELELLWIQTGNTTELASGYTTLGGDIMGGLSLIGNLPKTVVIELLRYFSTTYFKDSESLKQLLETKASAELADNQNDETDLMPFVVADLILFCLVGRKLDAKSIYAILQQQFEGIYSPIELRGWLEKFFNLFYHSIHKWTQLCVTLHLGKVHLDREGALRLPVAQTPPPIVF
jgi:NAD+ synthase (glutamine-hydrolysing)